MKLDAKNIIADCEKECYTFGELFYESIFEISLNSTHTDPFWHIVSLIENEKINVRKPNMAQVLCSWIKSMLNRNNQLVIEVI